MPKPQKPIAPYFSRRVLLPEFKALMAKGTGKGSIQADLDDIRGEQRSAAELNVLVARMARTKNPAKQDAIKAEIIRGFYGTKEPTV